VSAEKLRADLPMIKKTVLSNQTIYSMPEADAVNQ
jgi:hypothetical protein